jgi:hypothetical protein
MCDSNVVGNGGHSLFQETAAEAQAFSDKVDIGNVSQVGKRSLDGASSFWSGKHWGTSIQESVRRTLGGFLWAAVVGHDNLVDMRVPVVNGQGVLTKLAEGTFNGAHTAFHEAIALGVVWMDSPVVDEVFNQQCTESAMILSAVVGDDLSATAESGQDGIAESVCGGDCFFGWHGADYQGCAEVFDAMKQVDVASDSLGERSRCVHSPAEKEPIDGVRLQVDLRLVETGTNAVAEGTLLDGSFDVLHDTRPPIGSDQQVCGPSDAKVSTGLMGQQDKAGTVRRRGDEALDLHAQ